MREGDPKDYRALYSASKEHRGFSERQGAAIGMHLLVGVSPCWIEAKGGLHEPENTRNQKLLQEAVAWVESWAGEGSVFGARLDLDEDGGGVADVFSAPVAAQKHKAGSTKLTLSVNKALVKLQADYDAGCSYAALQTSWHAWAQEHLDRDLQRGEPALKTNRTHLRIAEYKRQQDYLKAEGTLRVEQQEISRREAIITRRERLNKEAATDLERKARVLAQTQKDIFAAAVAVLSDPDLRTIRPPAHEQERWWFDTPHFEAQRSAIMQARPLWPVMRQLVEVAHEKHRVIDSHIEKLRALLGEVDDHLRERIEQMEEEVSRSSALGSRP
jgi:hypothetical protein